MGRTAAARQAARQAAVLHSLMLSNAVNAAMHDFNIEPDMLLYATACQSHLDRKRFQIADRGSGTTQRHVAAAFDTHPYFVFMAFVLRLSPFLCLYKYTRHRGESGEASAMIHTRLAAVLFMAIKFHFTTTTTAEAAKKEIQTKDAVPKQQDTMLTVCAGVCGCVWGCGVPAYNYVCFV